MKKALFPGSFDPITVGHIEIIKRGARIFDQVVVAIGVNSSKKYRFSLEQRLMFLSKSLADVPNVQIASYTGLTVEFLKAHDIHFILRGLRSAADLAYEQPISLVNQHLHPVVDTLYLTSHPSTAHISSSIVREIIKYGGNITGLVPNCVVEAVAQS